MLRKSIIAFAAVLTVGTSGLAMSTTASAKGFGKHPGGHHFRSMHGHRLHGHRGWGWGYGPAFDFYGATAYAPGSYQFLSRRGFVRTVCE